MLENVNGKTILKGLPQVLLIGSSLLICVSVLYNLAFFQAIAPEYFNLLTVNDHVNSALGWLAYAPVALLPAIFWHYGFRIQQETSDAAIKFLKKVTRRKKTYRKLIQFGLNKKFIGIFIVLIEILIVGGLILLISFYALGKIWPFGNDFLEALGFTNKLHGYLKSSVLVLFYIVVFAYGTQKINHWFPRLLIIGFLIIVPLITGKVEAEYIFDRATIVKRRAELYQITLETRTYNNAIIMRSLEKGVIFMNASNHKINFVGWDKIIEISKITGQQNLLVDKLFSEDRDAEVADNENKVVAPVKKPIAR